MLLASPLGPIGFLCLRRMFQKGLFKGWGGVLGLAFAYGLLTFCILTGMRWLSGFLITYQVYFESVGGTCLCFMGIRAFRNKHAGNMPETGSKNDGAKDFMSIFFMTLFNPATFLSLTIILANLGVIANHIDLIFDVEFAFSVFSGTLFFWLLLGLLIQRIKKRLSQDFNLYLSRVSGVVLFIFGLIILIHVFIHSC